MYTNYACITLYIAHQKIHNIHWKECARGRSLIICVYIGGLMSCLFFQKNYSRWYGPFNQNKRHLPTYTDQNITKVFYHFGQKKKIVIITDPSPWRILSFPQIQGTEATCVFNYKCTEGVQKKFARFEGQENSLNSVGDS